MSFLVSIYLAPVTLFPSVYIPRVSCELSARIERGKPATATGHFRASLLLDDVSASYFRNEGRKKSCAVRKECGRQAGVLIEMQNESTPSPLPSTFPTPRRSLPFPRPIPTVAEPPFAVAKSKQQAERSKMGCASSSPAGDSTAAEKATNQAIDDEIRKDRAMRRCVLSVYRAPASRGVKLISLACDRMEAKMLLLGVS